MYKKYILITFLINGMFNSYGTDAQIPKEESINISSDQLLSNELADQKPIDSSPSSLIQSEPIAIDQNGEDLNKTNKEKDAFMMSLRLLNENIKLVEGYIKEETSAEIKNKLMLIENNFKEMLQKVNNKVKQIDDYIIQLKEKDKSKDDLLLHERLMKILEGQEAILKEKIGENPDSSIQSIASKLLFFILEKKTQEFYEVLIKDIKKFDSFDFTESLIKELISILEEFFKKKPLENIDFDKQIKQPFVNFINTKLKATKENVSIEKEGQEEIIQQIIGLLMVPNAENLLEKKGLFGMLKVWQYSEEESLKWYRDRTGDIQSFAITIMSQSPQNREKLLIILEKIYKSLSKEIQDTIKFQEIKEMIYPEIHAIKA